MVDPDPEAGLHRLPPGRHGLPPEFVVENQKGRLTAGIIKTVAEAGYPSATVSQIAAAAGVSRRTFYAYFISKEECFLATFDLVSNYLCQVAREAAEAEGDWPEAVRARIAAGVGVFAANPDLLRFCLVAPVQAGGALADRYQSRVGSALRELKAGKPAPPAAGEPSPVVQESLIGGMISLLSRKVEKGEGVDGLVPDLVLLFLTPYIGYEAAARVASGSQDKAEVRAQ